MANSNWYAESVANIFKNLNLATSATEQGLSSIEAVKRLKTFGANALPAPESPSVLKLFSRQFASPLIYILLIASVVVYFLGDLTDSFVILGVLLINAFIGLYQEGRAHNTLLALRSFAKTEAVAIRDGIEMSLADGEIVPGDIIMLREGDKIPADARLIEVRTFGVDESALTGESIPVSKSIETISRASSRGAHDAANSIALGDQKNMVFKGTFVAAGFAKAVVVSTGVKTVIGAISKQIVTLNTEIPLKKDIRKLSRLVAIGTLVASALVFILGFLQGNSAGTMFFTAVAVAVSLIPEGLPIVITIVLASGAYRMAKQNALVKNLDAVEALGQATVIAVDKTGTITKNELMVETVWVAGKKFSVDGSGYEPVGQISLDGAEISTAEIAFMGKIATFCASARVAFNEQEKIWHVAGDPTEAALLVFGEKTGLKKDELEVASPQIAELPFDSKLKYHLTLHNVGGKQFMTIVGAPEAILPLCNKQWFAANGADSSPAKSSALTLTIARKTEIEKQIHAMSKNGQRVIATAVIPAFKGELEPEKINAENKATFVGIFGMRDTLREGVREAVEAARERGLKVVMITGDHKVTAETIAREAGIFRDDDEVLTDKDLRELNETELLMRLSRVSVFARISPDEKLQLINLYRKNGEIVAMTGDGVNDALSLVAADLGVAMGKIGTEVSKEAADIVLLDDNFKSIVAAIDE
ncbi:MAG: HAD-IC family P-type ATPase, partial [Patescibacteria group bacterium]